MTVQGLVKKLQPDEMPHRGGAEGGGAPQGVEGGLGGVPHHPPPAPPPQNILGQIFLRTFDPSKIFSCAFGGNRFRPKIFFGAFGASKHSAPPGSSPPPPPPVPSLNKVRGGGTFSIDGNAELHEPGPASPLCPAPSPCQGMRYIIQCLEEQCPWPGRPAPPQKRASPVDAPHDDPAPLRGAPWPGHPSPSPSPGPGDREADPGEGAGPGPARRVQCPACVQQKPAGRGRQDLEEILASPVDKEAVVSEWKGMFVHLKLGKRSHLSEVCAGAVLGLRDRGWGMRGLGMRQGVFRMIENRVWGGGVPPMPLPPVPRRKGPL